MASLQSDKHKLPTKTCAQKPLVCVRRAQQKQGKPDLIRPDKLTKRRSYFRAPDCSFLLLIASLTQAQNNERQSGRTSNRCRPASCKRASRSVRRHRGHEICSLQLTQFAQRAARHQAIALIYLKCAPDEHANSSLKRQRVQLIRCNSLTV